MLNKYIKGTKNKIIATTLATTFAFSSSLALIPPVTSYATDTEDTANASMDAALAKVNETNTEIELKNSAEELIEAITSGAEEAISAAVDNVNEAAQAEDEADEALLALTDKTALTDADETKIQEAQNKLQEATAKIEEIMSGLSFSFATTEYWAAQAEYWAATTEYWAAIGFNEKEVISLVEDKRQEILENKPGYLTSRQEIDQKVLYQAIIKQRKALDKKQAVEFKSAEWWAADAMYWTATAEYWADKANAFTSTAKFWAAQAEDCDDDKSAAYTDKADKAQAQADKAQTQADKAQAHINDILPKEALTQANQAEAKMKAVKLWSAEWYAAQAEYWAAVGDKQQEAMAKSKAKQKAAEAKMDEAWDKYQAAEAKMDEYYAAQAECYIADAEYYAAEAEWCIADAEYYAAQAEYWTAVGDNRQIVEAKIDAAQAKIDAARAEKKAAQAEKKAAQDERQAIIKANRAEAEKKAAQAKMEALQAEHNTAATDN